jgi:hypothetical protein
MIIVGKEKNAQEGRTTSLEIFDFRCDLSFDSHGPLKMSFPWMHHLDFAFLQCTQHLYVPVFSKIPIIIWNHISNSITQESAQLVHILAKNVKPKD